MYKMDICFSSDNNYAPYMCSAIASILVNSLEDDSFVFHILDGGIGEDGIKKLNKLKEIKNFEIKFYNPDIDFFHRYLRLVK